MDVYRQTKEAIMTSLHPHKHAGSGKKREWYPMIDAIRGISLISMILFHFCYDVFVIFGVDSGWYRKTPVTIWQQSICITFILISGMSWHFSHNHVKRGLMLNLYGIIITLVTLIFIPSETIWFGILNFMGCAALLMIPLDYIFHRFSRSDGQPRTKTSLTGLLISLLLFSLTRNLAKGYLGLFGVVLVRLPERLYTSVVLTAFGLPFSGFRSSDYFPIFPWFFLFLAGYFLWRLAACLKWPLQILRCPVPVLSAVGKNTVWIYLLHQPILYVLAFLLTRLL